MTFFGGDLTMSHYSVGRKWINGEHPKTKNERAKKENAILKEHGYKTKYFQFKTTNIKAKAEAKEKAEQLAAQLTEKFGFEMEATEGCFL